MKIVLVENAKHGDGTQFLYLKPESHAETFQIEELFRQFEKCKIGVDDFDLDRDGTKALRLRVLDIDAPRVRPIPNENLK